MIKNGIIFLLVIIPAAILGMRFGFFLYTYFSDPVYQIPQNQIVEEVHEDATEVIENPPISDITIPEAAEQVEQNVLVENVVPKKVLVSESFSSGSKTMLPVPYVSEAPEGIWSGPWINGCEEASISMVEYYYRGRASVSVALAKSNMQKLFNAEDAKWNSNADADAYRTDFLITHHSSFNSQIVTNPTIDAIKHELQEGRPVISFHYGKKLYNPNIPFATYGTYYHVIVLVGFDDNAKEFIAHDDGDRRTGEYIRYSYDTIMNSLADYSFARHAADGPPTVIFTSPRFARTQISPRVYYIADGYKQYVTSPEVFVQKGWAWDAITTVRQEWLDQFPQGEDIRAQ